MADSAYARNTTRTSSSVADAARFPTASGRPASRKKGELGASIRQGRE